MSYAIEMVVGAREVLAEMDSESRTNILQCLRTELLTHDGKVPATATLVGGIGSPIEYYATPVSSGQVVVCRIMTKQELEWLANNRANAAEDHGVWVFDILSQSSFGELDRASLIRETHRLTGSSSSASISYLVVPAVTSDAPSALVDSMGVEPDARAIAALISSKATEPPIAIGLYGPWGSGKTSTMRMIERYIAHLSDYGDSDHESLFKSRITTVWFSAWQYSQGNIWASLVHHIFRSLADNPDKLQLLVDEVAERFEGASQSTADAKERVRRAAEELEMSNRAIFEARQKNDELIADLTKVRAWDAWAAIKDAFADAQLADEIRDAANELGLPELNVNARDLADSANQIINLARSTRVLATTGKWWRTPLAVGLYAAAFVAVLAIVIGAALHETQAWLATAIATIGQVTAIVAGMAAWLTRQAGVARELLNPAVRVRRRIADRVSIEEARHKAAVGRLEAQKSSIEQTLADAHYAQARAQDELDAASAAKDELTGDKLFRRYLSERAESGDYEQYLGVVALAHRDLTGLQSHLRRALDDSGGVDAPERIVLFIDDLDRCPPPIVASVLDAVNLLLALPLFAVVVGVDPQWLYMSLQSEHTSLRTVEVEDERFATSEAYLEKIFQITYTLPSPTGTTAGNLLVHAARQTQLSPPATTVPARTLADETVSDEVPDDLSAGMPAELMESLTLSDADFTNLKGIAPLVASTPRRIKRFLNIYLVIRARILADGEQRSLFVGDPDTADRSGWSLILTVALIVGLPVEAPTRFRSASADSAHDSPANSLARWLIEWQPRRLDERERLTAFRDTVDNTEQSLLDGLSQIDLIRWWPIVNRYV